MIDCDWKNAERIKCSVIYRPTYYHSLSDKSKKSQFRQVISFNTGVAATATAITLGSNYDGITATTTGVSLDQNSSIGTGMYLQNISDIRVYEGDSVDVNDTLFISESTNPNWFEITNSGTFTINAWGTDTSDGKVFFSIRIL